MTYRPTESRLPAGLGPEGSPRILAGPTSQPLPDLTTRIPSAARVRHFLGDRA